MITPSETEELKALIKKYDLDLISFELEIPVEELEQLKREMDEDVKNDSSIKLRASTGKVDDRYIKVLQAHSRLEKMRERYKKLLVGKKKEEKENNPKIQRSEESVNAIINKIQEIVNGLRGKSATEKRDGAFAVMAELRKIQNCKLTMEQAENLNEAMQSKDLNGLKQGINDRNNINTSIENRRAMVTEKVIEAIDIAKNQTDDVEELKRLLSKITMKMRQEHISANAVASKIYARIQNISMQKHREEIRANVLGIARDLADGTLDIQSASKIIEEEARNRVKNGSNSKFALTQEQQRGQILHEIQTLIGDKADEFQLEDPEKTLLLLQKLCGIDAQEAARSVIENLIFRKDFEMAKKILNNYYAKNVDDSNYIETRNLRTRMINAELGDLVSRAINSKGSMEEELDYLELIEQGIKMGNVKLGSIVLGKSQDGLKKITLYDIWTDEKEKQLN